MPENVRTLTRWLVAPATDQVRREQAAGAAFLRILLGLMWLYNVEWKRPPDFGRDTGGGLFHFTSLAVSHPVFPPYSWIVEHLVLPNIVVFGWAVLIVETALAVMLLTGAWVRVAAALGVAQSLAIALSVASAPHEWPWAYWLMIGAHVTVLFSSAGRVLAVDAVRSGTVPARRLGQFWGVLAVVVGAYSVLNSAGDPGTPRGSGLTSTGLMVGLGSYNLYGGLVLVVAGVLLLVAARSHVAPLGWAAAGVAGVAALSLYAQIGFSGPFLGGTLTSAALLLSLAVVAATVTAAAGRAAPRE
ncbi:hypothetical protein [Streptomyces sp. H34-S4]|uniref:Rv1678 family membrane protein n=1 Tax=Streptomyces sp. H34-S4 TaxID=2996463 RepID=UPI002271A400|nr:hypothetical protein [Streptomyces sp. H34-S4]MCY0933921.1 hypothetical protein [Streptomyces sp. H34-S4]